jgi:hypothetical protein
MFENLVNFVQGCEIASLYVNKETGEWLGLQKPGYDLMSREEILKLTGSPEESETAETASTKKGKTKKEAAE